MTVMPLRPTPLLPRMHMQKWFLVTICLFSTQKCGMNISFDHTLSVLLRMSALQVCLVRMCSFLAIKGHLFNWK